MRTDTAHTGRRPGVFAATLVAVLMVLVACSRQGGADVESLEAAARSNPDAADGSALASNEDAGELVISDFGGTWAEAIDVALIAPFEQETGIDVELLNSQDEALVIAALEEGEPPPYDLSSSNFALVKSYSEQGYLEPIDYSVFSDEVLGVWPEELQAEYGIGWAQLANVICYDSEAIPDGVEPPSGWSDFWDVETYPGGRSMLGWNSDPAIHNALLADGVAPEDLYPLDIDRAFEKLEELDPSIPTYTDNSGALLQLLIDGEISMAQCFSHRMQALIDSGFSTGAISWDQAELINQAYIVWRDSPNRGNAMRFLAYVVEPENQARWARLSNAAPANPDAFAEIPEVDAAKLPTAPANSATAVPRNDDWLNSEHEDGMTNADHIITVRWPQFVGG